MAEDLIGIKRDLFFDLMKLAGRVFVLAEYAEDVVIGNRGFLPEEKEKGIVLVFNPRMNFSWDDNGLSARLVFGNTAEKCSIPAERILAVFSPELNAQFTTGPLPAEKTAEGKKENPRKTGKGEKVVKIDFNRKP